MMRVFRVFAAASLLCIAPAMAQAPVETGTTSASTAPIDPSSDPGTWRRIDAENLLWLLINGQVVLVELRPDFAPQHVAQIKTIVRNGHYDGLPFHRVIDDFMAQGGEVASVYSLPEPYPVIVPEFTFRRNPTTTPITLVSRPGEPAIWGYADGIVVQSQSESIAPMMADQSVNSWMMHCPGVASMARADAPNSADTQFFLMRQAQTQLDQNYTAWGRVVVGLDVVRGIKAGPAETDGRLPPDQADRLMRAEIVADLPAADQPVVYVQQTNSPAFTSTLATLTEGGVRDPCALPPVPVIVENFNRG